MEMGWIYRIKVKLGTGLFHVEQIGWSFHIITCQYKSEKISLLAGRLT